MPIHIFFGRLELGKSGDWQYVGLDIAFNNQTYLDFSLGYNNLTYSRLSFSNTVLTYWGLDTAANNLTYLGGSPSNDNLTYWGIYTADDNLSYLGWSLNNKDPQRMTVDPMFMIVQSLRSFLTTVAPTAVTPIAIILHDFT